MTASAPIVEVVNEVPGLFLVRGLLDRDDQLGTMRLIDQGHWRRDLRRRTQHFGYKYDYRSKTIDESARIGPLPLWITDLGALVNKATEGLVPAQVWDQCILNEYLRGQGIGEHSDSPAFGPIVASVTLLGQAVMELRPAYGVDPCYTIPLLAGEALVFTGPSRYPWTHSIDGETTLSRRVSATFRTVLP